METGTLAARQAIPIFYRISPALDPMGTVVFIHGFAEHSGRYGHFVDVLNAARFNVLLIDLRGHGYSAGKRGYIDNFEQYVDDVDRAVEHARKKFGVKKVLLAAHSMGGLVCLYYAAKHSRKCQGLVMSSPLFGIRVAVPAWKYCLGQVFSKLWPGFSLPTEVSSHKLTHDKRLTHAYETDPLIFHHVTTRWFSEILKASSGIKGLAQEWHLPIFLQVAGDDAIVNSRCSTDWFEHCAAKDKKIQIYDGFYHEIYNEVHRKRPIDDCVQWLRAHCDAQLSQTTSKQHSMEATV